MCQNQEKPCAPFEPRLADIIQLQLVVVLFRTYVTSEASLFHGHTLPVGRMPTACFHTPGCRSKCACQAAHVQQGSHDTHRASPHCMAAIIWSDGMCTGDRDERYASLRGRLMDTVQHVDMSEACTTVQHRSLRREASHKLRLPPGSGSGHMGNGHCWL